MALVLPELRPRGHQGAPEVDKARVGSTEVPSDPQSTSDTDANPTKSYPYQGPMRLSQEGKTPTKRKRPCGGRHPCAGGDPQGRPGID